MKQKWHFFAVIPSKRSISSITHANREGEGVKPDVAAKVGDALATAREMIERQVHGSAPSVAANR